MHVEVLKKALLLSRVTRKKERIITSAASSIEPGPRTPMHVGLWRGSAIDEVETKASGSMTNIVQNGHGV